MIHYLHFFFLWRRNNVNFQWYSFISDSTFSVYFDCLLQYRYLFLLIHTATKFFNCTHVFSMAEGWSAELYKSRSNKYSCKLKEACRTFLHMRQLHSKLDEQSISKPYILKQCSSTKAYETEFFLNRIWIKIQNSSINVTSLYWKDWTN